ncbi:hypothetical protein BDV37DRAFT_262488 [Aspergillus pseudonomiae]|uniref:Secreted protein n=1 Tax=Aspergillus pseudonomiae TaxID=1506151 RepID=A0A5N7CX99_9EURO|nr:uncharacterized protein BDV37DRAFT_262488 [Aspergillus pseudonomiae]KAE8398814.1 hypothetical protein BDV37DRAFT_262488 [Aspergillus pseudonomiae]
MRIIILMIIVVCILGSYSLRPGDLHKSCCATLSAPVGWASLEMVPNSLAITLVGGHWHVMPSLHDMLSLLTACLKDSSQTSVDQVHLLPIIGD